MLDGKSSQKIIEEFRDLSLEKWNFREIIRRILLTLLAQQRTYWRQIDSLLKWVKLGDAGTRCFHTNATIRNRKKNLITARCHMSNTCIIYTTHANSEQLLWQAFKERLETSAFNDIRFNLHSFIQASERQQKISQQKKLTMLSRCCHMISHLGFMGLLMNSLKIWPIVKVDFYELCMAFQHNNICLQSINSSFITLVPKVDNPSVVSDYRPTSLLNASMKLITKLISGKQNSISNNEPDT